MGCFRQSKRRVALFLEQVLNQPCSAGWVVKLQQQATAASATRLARIGRAAFCPRSRCWESMNHRRKKVRLEVCGCGRSLPSQFTVYAPADPRVPRRSCQELLGDTFDGVVNCDRAKMYWQIGRPQWCWAHLKRDFQALVDHPDQPGQAVWDATCCGPPRVVSALGALPRWHDHPTWACQRLMRPIRQEIDSLLLRGAFSGNAKLVGMCQRSCTTIATGCGRSWKWRASSRRTTPASARCVTAVIWRKLSFGTQSAAGSRFVETILTVVETCRQQSRQELPVSPQRSRPTCR